MSSSLISKWMQFISDETKVLPVGRWNWSAHIRNSCKNWRSEEAQFYNIHKQDIFLCSITIGVPMTSVWIFQSSWEMFVADCRKKLMQSQSMTEIASFSRWVAHVIQPMLGYAMDNSTNVILSFKTRGKGGPRSYKLHKKAKCIPRDIYWVIINK